MHVVATVTGSKFKEVLEGRLFSVFLMVSVRDLGWLPQSRPLFLFGWLAQEGGLTEPNPTALIRFSLSTDFFV